MTSIAEIFTSDVLVKILQLFLLNPDRAFYQAEIQRQIEGRLYNTQKMLHKLEQVGLVNSYKQGRMVFYKAERKHPAFEDLKRLFLKTVAVGELLRENLQSLSSKVQFAFIYGSYARGEESRDSDIDICLLGDLSLKAVSQAIGQVSQELCREVNPVIYSVSDYHDRLVSGERFAEELHSCPKIWLIGTEHEFLEMTHRQKI